MAERMSLVWFAGCGDDDESRQEVFQQLHDGLHREFGRPGYVEVSFFDASAAESKLAAAGLTDHPEAPGLLAWSGELWSCPLCTVQRHSDTCKQPGCSVDPPQAYIDGCTDSLLAYARDLGLVPKEPA